MLRLFLRRNHEDRSRDADITHISSQVPVIDLPLLSDGDDTELKKLDLACWDWCFFQVINHGVAAEVLQRMKDVAAGFFKLPFEEKKKYSMAPNDIQGYGQAYVVSEEQKLDWADTLILLIYPSQFRKIKYWPSTPPELKETFEAYSAEVNKVTERLLGTLSLMMGMDKDALLGMHKEVMQALRVNYYPTCCRPDQVLGLSPHSDTSSIIILQQDDDVIGLQIPHDGGWVPVKPIKDALVVNIGDIIEIWSNRKYKSIEHRAITNQKKARISFASFVCQNDDVEIEPLDQMVDYQQPVRMYKKIKYADDLRHSMERKMEGKAHTQIVKFEN